MSFRIDVVSELHLYVSILFNWLLRKQKKGSICKESIVSFSLTCKRYFHCLENYHQYKINFQSVSKSKFDLVCRLRNPSNITSLILSDT